MIIFVKKKINAKTNSAKVNNNRADNSKVNSIRLDIKIKVIGKPESINWLRNIGRSVDNIKLRVAKSIKVNIIISKFRIVILYNFYLNITILLKFLIY